MKNNIDKDLQIKLMEGLASEYPNGYHLRKIRKFVPQETSVAKIIANLKYLKWHELVTLNVYECVDGETLLGSATLTPKGIDYLSANGGLTAELSVVTVKLHADTIHDLLIAKIQSSDANPTVKKNLINKLKELPANAMEKILSAGFEKGIAAVPDIAVWLGNILSHM